MNNICIKNNFINNGNMNMNYMNNFMGMNSINNCLLYNINNFHNMNFMITKYYIK